MPPVTQDNNVVNRSIRLLSFLTSGVPTVISIFCIGLVSGAAGGLLLGATAVVLLQSLELLADNRTLNIQSEKCMNDSDRLYARYDQVHDTQISLFAVTHGVLSSILSVAVGLSVGYSTYTLSKREQTERKDVAVRGKALAVAGSVCLMVVTATGCLLGFTLESFLSMTSYGAIWLFIISLVVILMTSSMISFLHPCVSACIGCILFTLFTSSLTFVIYFMLKVKFILASICVPVTVAVNLLQESHPLKLHTVTVRLMLIISDVYNIARQHIVALQSKTSTTTSSVVADAIFVGLLASLMWTVTVGMSLFVAWQRGGAGKICATATATGSAVLGVLRLGLPVLGPGPIIGGLTGVAGAAGVSLAAAGAVIAQYGPVVHGYRLFGWLGVTVGAAVGAFFMSCAHSGLSVMFMALCAATVPPGAFLLMFAQSASSRLKQCLYLYLAPLAIILFTFAVSCPFMPSNYHGGMFVLCIDYSVLFFFGMSF